MASREGYSPPAHPRKNIMKQMEMEEMLHTKMEIDARLAKVRKDQANQRAVARCLLRDDVVAVEVREDGTLLCTDFEGRQILRPAGWRGRS